MYAELDHQITLDLGGRRCRHLFDAARGETLLVQAAAPSLHRHCGSGGDVLVSTGVPILPSEQPETDGPLGTVVLARARAGLGVHFEAGGRLRADSP